MTVEVPDDGPVRTVTLRRPPANALTAVEYTALRETFIAPSDGVRVVVLRGDGASFCAGQDLAEARSLTPAQIDPHLLLAGSAVAAAAWSPLPLVTAVGGPAVGTGALLVALADVVVMADGAWLSFPEAGYGMPVGLSLLARYVPARYVPARTARRLLATGGPTGAGELAALGAVDHLVAAEQLDRATDTAVQQLLGLSPAMAAWLFAGPERASREADYLAEVRAAADAQAWHFERATRPARGAG
ncbi:MAG TPA: enoyl-CoA hydratase/isomerase family protein [Mycobacteriales bacterium]|nr:enoyl-CoA hydratase/isomerase family protein [Mycobacteriales bacterium]